MKRIKPSRAGARFNRAPTVGMMAWRNLTAHPLRSTLTALAIALGVGMVLAAAIIGQAAGQSTSEFADERPRIDLEIRARDDGPFSETVLDELRAAQDIERACPSLRVVVAGVRPATSDLTLLGVDPEAFYALHAPELASGTFLDTPDGIVLPMALAIDSGLNVGEELTLASGAQTATLQVSGRLKLEQDVSALAQETVAYVPLHVAQHLAEATMHIGRIEIVLRQGVDVDSARTNLAAKLGADLIVVRTTTAGSPGVSVALVQLGLIMVGAIMLFAAAFVIFNAFAMSVTGRTREIGALRALGMTRRQVMGQVWAEARWLSLIGVILGLAVGLALAWVIMSIMGTLDDAPFVVPWWGVGLSLVLGLSVTLIGALQPAWRASCVSPLVAVRPHSADGDTGRYVRYGGRVGAILLLISLPGVSAIALILRPNFLQSFALLGLGQAGLLLATVLVLPALVSPVVALCRPLLVRWWGTAGRLAADNLSRNKLRTVLTVGALTAALATIITTSGMTTTLLKGGLRGYFDFFNEDGMVMPDIPALIASGELSVENSYERLTTRAVLDPGLVEVVETVAEANGIAIERIGFAPIPPELAPIAGSPGVFVEPQVFLGLGNFDFFEGDAESAIRLMQRGRAILLFPITAEKLGVGVGDTIPVQTPHGEIAFTVAGIGGNGYNFTTFSYADGVAYFDMVGPSWLGLIVPEGKDVGEAVLQVHQVVEPFEGVMADELNADALESSFFKLVNRLQLLLNALLVLAVVVAGLGVVNTIVINVAERGREIALFRAVGATRRQVRQAVMAEAVVLGLMAALVATGLSLAILGLLVVVITPGGTESMGIRVSWETAALALPAGLRDLGIAAALSLVLGPAVAALAAYVPARRAAAAAVIEATRSEQVSLKQTAPKRPEGRRDGHHGARSLAWALAWRHLTTHPLRSVLTAMAIALGVGMVLAASIVGQAAGRSAGEFAREGSRVDLELFSRDGDPFDAAVLETLRASPDVAHLSPSLRIEAEILSTDGDALPTDGTGLPTAPLTLLGVDPAAYRALHDPELAGGAFLDAPDAIVLPMMAALDHGLRPGDEVTLRAGDRTAALVVSGRLSMDERPAEGLVPLGVAQTLGGTPDQIDRIEIALQPHADLDQARAGLSKLVGSAFVVVQAEVGGGVGFNTALIQGGVAMVGLMILFAAGFVILNAFAMSVVGRTCEIGALRALGMTRRQVIQTVLLEAGLLGLMGAAAGVLIGLALAWIVMDARGLLGQVVFAVPWWGLVLSPLMGLAVTLVGALQPAWRAGRVAPIEAVRAETGAVSGWYVRSGGRVGALLAILLLPALAAYGLIGRPDIWKAMAATGLGIAGLLVAAVLLLPALVGGVGSGFQALLSRRFGAAGRLAADNLRRNRLRSALTAGALVAGLTMIVAASGLLPLFLEGSIGLIGSVMHEDMVVTADLVEAMTSGEMTLENIYRSMAELSVDPTVADRLSSLVEAGQIELQRVGIAAVPPDLATVPTGRESAGMFVDLEPFIRIGNFDFYQGDPETALQLARRGRGVLLQPLAAERLGVSVGDALPLETPQGEVTFTVVGIGGSGLFSPIFSYADGEDYFDLAGLFQLGVIVAEGQDVDAVKARVEQSLQSVPGVLVLEDVDGIIDEATTMFDRFRVLLDALLLLAVIVAGLGVVNTMVINVTERGREIGLLRAVGATRRQVRQMIVAEAAALGLMAALTAIALGLLMVLVYAMVVMPNGWGALGMRSDWATIRGQLLAALSDMGLAAAISLIAGPAVAVLAAYVPARQAAALDVVEATRSERVVLRKSGGRRPEVQRTSQVRRTWAWTMAWRNLTQARTRTILSVLAVALGVAMTVAADLTSSAILNALAKSEDAQIFMTGLLDQLDRMLVLVGVMITVAAGFLVFNAFAMSITQRRRQIGALRSVGMTRRQVIRLVLAEALLTGGAGTLLGLIAGPILGRGTIGLMKTMLGEGIFVFAAGSASPSILLLAAGLGTGITLLSVLIPAWRAARVSPLTALQEERASVIEHNPVVRFLIGLLVIVLLFVYLALAPPGEWVSPPWDTGLTVLFVALWLGCLALILPALIGGVGRWVRRPLARLWGATGRLMADNVQRGRGRVTLTVLTLIVALTMIASLTGFFQFVMHELFWSKMELIGAQGALGLAPIDIMAGMSAYSDMESIAIPPEALAAVRQTAADRAEIVEFHFVIVPELSFFGNSYFSFIVEPDELRHGGRFAFRFIEGDWQTALSIMDDGCGALVMPLVAGKNGVSVGETVQVSGAEGPVACTMAGIGESFVGASIITSAGATDFRVTDTSIVAIIPLPGEDRDALKADLMAVTDGFQNAELMEIENLTKLQLEVIDALPTLFNALLLLAILAAALGVVNTTVMSVAERRRELGLLRAVGATRRQVSRVVIGEAALMGLVGGGLGLVAGVGITVILVVTYGGNAWGVPDLDLWPAAWRSVQPVLLTGLIGLIAAPFICAGAAWLPGRRILRGNAVETLKPTAPPSVGANRRLAPTLRMLAWRNLSQARTRTVLSVLAVALGVAVIVATGVTRSGVESGVEGSLQESVVFVTDMVGMGLSIAGVMILVAAGFLIFNAFGMAVTERRRQIGALRSVGMTRHQVMRLVLLEALIVGGTGTGLGLVAGPMLGRGVLAGMRTAGYELGSGSVSPWGLLLALVMGQTITLVSAWLPARRAARISPLTALRSEVAAGIGRMSRGRVLVALALMAVLWGYLAIAPPGEWVLEPWNYALPFILLIPWLGALFSLAPAFVVGVGRIARAPLARLWRASGSLMADNLRRGQGRVAVTALTFAVSVMTVVGVTGVFNFFGKVLIDHAQETRLQNGLVPGWSIGAADFTQGVMNVGGMIDALDPEVIAEVRRVAEGRATVGVERPVVVPEFAAVLVPNYFSSMIDLELLAVPGNVRFIEGDLETALPVMEAGCGVLLAPGAAARNGVGVGETLTIQSKDGSLDCAVAGVVAAGMVPVSFVSPAVADDLDAGDPTSIIIFPRLGIDRAAMEADLRAIDEKYGDDAWLLSWQENVDTVAENTDRVLSLMSSLLVLAVVAAALGLINTTVMSVNERQRELGLFRAVGATRRQGMAVVVGEAALIGLVGSVLGLIAGAGIGAIFALGHGGKVWGYPDLDLWAAAWRSVRPALQNGLMGLVAAPLLSAAAAWLPGRRVLRGSPVETLERGRQMQRTMTGRTPWHRGSIRTRFVLGTALLMLVLLVGLIAAVTAHERGYLEDWTRETLVMMVEGQAGLIELNLPDDAQSLALADLEMGEFDADALLRFRALMDDMSAYGLHRFAVTDSDGVVLLSLDPREIGTLLPSPETPDETEIISEREAGEWRLRAAAPIRNDASEAVGSVRVMVGLTHLQRLLDRTRNALLIVGGIVTALALAVSWAMTTPLVRATGRLAARASRVADGEYGSLTLRRGRWTRLVDRTSLRLRLTVALVAIVALLVGVLEVAIVPIQRRHVEGELQEGMASAATWLGQATSEGLEVGLLPEDSFSLEELFSMTGGMDWARFQELTETTRGQDVAYMALVDRDGVIQFSDQISLIGETASVPAETQVEEARWRDEDIWAISTPLREGRDGEVVGALRMGLRRASVEAFLAESRTLFRLSGLVALLAGVLLAQLVGGAVTAPVREMAAGVRRVGQGDLSVRFRVEARDELAQLAGAFNQMVAGLREREWLRDMFGRFVSREVAEAIRTGQVKLEGENRVVSVLFCDIRGFTARSEKSTPEEVVALLNEYLPVVVEAAQAHAGTVNKFGGDSTLIIYGAPKPLQESAYQAVRTALEMRSGLARLNERLVARGEEPIRVGVGINTGVALAGAVGPEERQEYTVIGDAVNLASRIEALNKQYPAHDVLISDWTYQALGGRRIEFAFEDLGVMTIRGKAEPVRIWSVRGIK